MMIEKLKTSPANEPPRTGFLRSSGEVHNRSERNIDGFERPSVTVELIKTSAISS